jgi:hypothetical protein
MDLDLRHFRSNSMTMAIRRPSGSGASKVQLATFTISSLILHNQRGVRVRAFFPDVEIILYASYLAYDNS